MLRGAHGVVVAPGFGARGVKGKLRAIRHVRERKIPFLGICYGMQLACVEFARNVCELPDAMTSEVDETSADPVIDFMPDQRNLEMYGGTMRLGTYSCTLEPGSQAARAYGELEISERHRHRYEFNNRYRPIFEEHGMRFTGHHTIGQDAAGRGRRASAGDAPVVRGDASASRVQIAAEPPGAALSRFHRCGAGAPRARRGPHRRCRGGDLDPGLITAVVLTRDEERNLPRALTSLPRGIALLVLDARSRDHTVAVRARSGRTRHPARVDRFRRRAALRAGAGRRRRGR